MRLPYTHLTRKGNIRNAARLTGVNASTNRVSWAWWQLLSRSSPDAYRAPVAVLWEANLGRLGLRLVLDLVGLLGFLVSLRPPELLITTSGDDPVTTVVVDCVEPGSGGVGESGGVPAGVFVEVGEFDAGGGDPCEASAADELLSCGGGESDDGGAPESSAHAMPGWVATAAPTPSTTASAPTRPM